MLDGGHPWVIGDEYSDILRTDATDGVLSSSDESGVDPEGFCAHLNIDAGKCSVSGIACTLRLVPGGDPRAGEWRSGVCAERERENSV